MDKKINLATIKLDGIPGRGMVSAEPELDEEYGIRWRIMVTLPDGTEEDPEVSTLWGGTLDDAVECVDLSWGCGGGGPDVWELEWIEND